MNKKNPLVWWFCLLFCLVALPAGATTISIQIVQMDDVHGDVTDSSLLIELSLNSGKGDNDNMMRSFLVGPV